MSLADKLRVLRFAAQVHGVTLTEDEEAKTLLYIAIEMADWPFQVAVAQVMEILAGVRL